MTPNETELGDMVAQLGGAMELVADADALVASKTHQPVVVTYGGEGVVVVTADPGIASRPAPHVGT